MWTIFVLTLVGLAVGACLLALISQPARGIDDLDLAIESESWFRVDAEVVSVLRTSNRAFLLVRYMVGTTVVHADVQYPTTDALPHAGQRIAIRTDPTAPARAVFDPEPLGPLAMAAPRRPATLTLRTRSTYSGNR